MGIMVSAADARILDRLDWFRRIGMVFLGSRSFVYWETAVAYALLPADPTLTVTGRRRVVRGSSGRWVVTQTFTPRRMLMVTRPHDLGSSRPQ